MIDTEEDVTLTSPVPPVAVDGQLVIGRRVSTDGPLKLSLTLVRRDGLHELGALALDGQWERWGLVSSHDAVGLVGEAPQNGFAWSRIDLRGEVTSTNSPLQRQLPSVLEWGANMIVLVILLALVSPLLIILWRRDPNRTQPTLPEGMMVGDLGTRAMAFVIDLVPSLLVMVAVFKVKPMDIPQHWPGFFAQSNKWSDLLPGLTAIGIFVVYSTVWEMVSGQTLGKRVMGLRVVNFDGGKADALQILLRNIFKAVELSLQFLLILPVINAFRQRLGDIVGRTVVVTMQSPEAADERDDEDLP